ncbi:MAG: phage holin family protein [Candidatus Paceibacterota bacterium]
MNFLKKLFLGIVLNSLAILLCQRLFNELFNDFYFQGTFIELILLALIISFLNLLIKPILRLIFLPLIWITLGLFSLIINIIILKTATVFMPVLIIQSPIVWLIASIIISSFNSLMYK